MVLDISSRSQVIFKVDFLRIDVPTSAVLSRSVSSSISQLEEYAAVVDFFIAAFKRKI